MIDTGQKLFGYPIHVCEQGESLEGDKNLPAVKIQRSVLKKALATAGKALRKICDKDRIRQEAKHAPMIGEGI